MLSTITWAVPSETGLETCSEDQEMEDIDKLVRRAESAGITFCFDRLGAMSVLVPRETIEDDLFDDVGARLEAIQVHLIKARNVYASFGAVPDAEPSERASAESLLV